MSRSGYLAAIAGQRPGNTGKRRRLTDLTPARRRPGLEPPRAADETAAGDPSPGGAKPPPLDHPPDPGVAERSPGSAVPIPPVPAAEPPSVLAPPLARLNGTVRPGSDAPARLRAPDAGTGPLGWNRAAGVPRAADRPGAESRPASRPGRTTEPGSVPAASAPGDAIAPVPPSAVPLAPEPARNRAAPAEPARPTAESVPARPESDRSAPARSGPAALLPSARPGPDDERARPRALAPARRTAREPVRLHIGTIDITVVPPPPAAPAAPAPRPARTVPVRTVPADAPLTRGPGPWFGAGQR
jgi:hypothetical protein